MGEGRSRQLNWLARGDLVGLAAPDANEFIARWDRYDDARIAMVAAFQTTGATILKPPVTREHREWLWDVINEGVLVPVDIRTLDDERFVGEAGVARTTWPGGSGELAAALFDPADRGRGYGTEAMVLFAAYCFDGLGLNRVTIRYLSVNEPVIRAVARTAETVGGRLVGVERQAEWAYGARRDRMIVEVLREDFPPHRATAHLRS